MYLYTPNTYTPPSSGVKVVRDVTLTGLKEEDGNLRGVELTPNEGEIVTMTCATLITLQDTVIDKDTFDGK